MRICCRIGFSVAMLLMVGCGGGSDSPVTITAAPPPAPPPAPSVTVSPTSLTVAEGGEATYTIVLDSPPADNVTVTPTSTNSGAATVSGVLTFTTGDWNTPQSVTVSGVEENNADAADESLSITHAVSGYGSVTTAEEVRVTVDDDDVEANGIYGSYSDFLRARENRLAGGLVILHDGQMIGKAALAQRNTASHPIGPYEFAFSGTYAMDGDQISAQVRGDEFKENPTADFLEAKSVSGTVVEQDSLQLTLADEDGEENRLSMDYGAHYDRPSSVAQWEGTWGFTQRGISLATMTVDADGTFFGQFANGCVLTGSLSILNADHNLYGLQFAMESCDFDFWHGDYTGFAFLDDVNDGDSNEGVMIGLRDDDFDWILSLVRQ